MNPANLALLDIISSCVAVSQSLEKKGNAMTADFWRFKED
jgi:hypothetical protein